MSIPVRYPLALGFTLLAVAVGSAAAQTAPAASPVLAPAKIAPTTVTLKLEEALVEDVFSQITEQTGIKFSTQPGNLFEQDQFQVPKAVNVDKKDFWPALQEICDTFNVYPQLYNYYGPGRGDARRITLAMGNNPWGKHPVCASGLFMITANSVSRSTYIQLGNPNQPKNPGSTNIQFTVFADPKLRLAGSNNQIKLEEAKDENGLSLLPPNLGNNVYYGGYGETPRGFTFSTSVNLVMPENAGTRIATLKGTMQVPVITKQEKWEVADVLNVKDVSKKFGNSTYTLKKITPQGKDGNNPYYTVEVAVSTTNMTDGRFDSSNMIGDINRIQLLDADGKLYVSNGWGGGGSNGMVTRSITFMPAERFNGNGGDVANTGAPVKLVWEIPTEIKELTVPVSFSDLPLP